MFLLRKLLKFPFVFVLLMILTRIITNSTAVFNIKKPKETLKAN